jgi:hypothetical protein
VDVVEPVAEPVAEPEPLDVEAVAAEVVMPETEVVEIPEVQAERVPGEDDDLGGITPVGYQLLVPGKTEPVSVHDTLDEWQDAYEDMADKVAKAGKRPARERMTILRELKEANERTINRVDMVKRIRHTAAYSRRIKALGAAQ